MISTLEQKQGRGNGTGSVRGQRGRTGWNFKQLDQSRPRWEGNTSAGGSEGSESLGPAFRGNSRQREQCVQRWRGKLLRVFKRKSDRKWFLFCRDRRAVSGRGDSRKASWNLPGGCNEMSGRDGASEVVRTGSALRLFEGRTAWFAEVSMSCMREKEEPEVWSQSSWRD